MACSPCRLLRRAKDHLKHDGIVTTIEAGFKRPLILDKGTIMNNKSMQCELYINAQDTKTLKM